MFITYQSNTFDIMIKNFFRIKSMMQKLFSLSALCWVHVFVINLDSFNFGINFKHFSSISSISLEQK
jgi:hypothetical protein|tara:strand:+ start:337 stop:537 length:201 start_codon:yes stop_codon:yes gene_type:complete